MIGLGMGEWSLIAKLPDSESMWDFVYVFEVNIESPDSC